MTSPATASAAPPSDGQVALRLTDVHTYYGHIHALQGISLEVRHGEIVTLLGANGAGKTTTLKTIHGLLHPREGRIEFEGRDITRLPAHEHVGIGIGQAPEGRRIFFRMTVLENLQMGAYSRRDVRTLDDDFDRVFELFPVLKERRSQTAGTLSGGEQQMLAIGRALMIRPKLLMLDEPSLGLSPILVQEIFSIITDINRQGATILLVEQNALMALGVASRGYVLQTGRIVRSGEAKDLLQDEEVRKAYLGG
jgi:branched-chain amino acid transport system ATP-binding protein